MARLKKYGAALLAMMLLVSTMGTAAAAVAVDTETSSTSSTSDVTTSTAVTLNQTTSGARALQITGATADAAVYVLTADGEQVAKFDDFNKVASGTFKTSITDSELRQRLPVTDDGQADTYNLKIVGDDTVSNPSTTTISITVNASGISSIEADEQADVSKDSGIVPDVLGPQTEASTERDSVPVSAGGEIVVQADNKDYQNAVNSVVSSDAKQGQIVPMTVLVNGQAQEVYYGSAPSDASGTYGVLQSDGDVVVQFADNYSKNTADVTVSNEPMDINDAIDVYGFGAEALDAALPISL